MKKQSASTINLYRIKKDLDKKQTIEALKNALDWSWVKVRPRKRKKVIGQT